jgi:hypothetical protein
MDEISSPNDEFGGFRLDTALHALISPSAETMPLQSRAFATLRYLIERSGEVIDEGAIMSTVWPKTVVAENNLNQSILALRREIPIDSGGPARLIHTGCSPCRWPLDGRTLYVGLNIQERVALAGTTAILPTGPDDLPQLPPAAAGARLIPLQSEGLWIGPNPTVYVYVQTELRQNIDRIPLH